MPRRKKDAAGKTILVVAADESGSMYEQADNVRNGFNEYTETVRSNTENVVVSLVKFDSQVTTVFKNTPINDVPRLDINNYMPGGSTALYDGVAAAIKVADQAVTKNDKVIIVIFTDGQENASSENTREQIFQKVTSKQNKGNWTFVFLGADQDAWANSQAIGILRGNTVSYAGSNTRGTYANLATSTSAHATSAVAGTSTFFADAGQSEEDYNKPNP